MLASHARKAVDLSSRLMSFDNPRCYKGIEKVLEVLVWVKNKIECPFYTNKTTGVHIRLGNNSRSICLYRVSRRILQLMASQQRNMGALHPSNRILYLQRSIDDDSYAPPFPPLSFVYRCNRNDSANPGTFDWLRRIETTKHSHWQDVPGSVVRPYPCAHSATLNLDNTYTNLNDGRHAEDLTNTIEFCQYAGTLGFL